MKTKADYSRDGLLPPPPLSLRAIRDHLSQRAVVSRTGALRVECHFITRRSA